MTYGKPLKIGIWKVFLCCFWAGILAGTLVGNWGTIRERSAEKSTEKQIVIEPGESYGESVKTENFYPDTLFWRKRAGDREKFYFLCQRRLKEGGLGWLLGLTVCAAFCYCLLAVYAGFLIGWTITLYTIELGFMGLPSFILSCFPQMLLYLPAWGLLLWQGLEGKAKIRPLLFLAAALFLCTGAGLEAFVNPLFL